MSGGFGCQGRRRDEGDRPVCTTSGRKIGDTSRRRPEGLAFTARGRQAPG